MGELKWPTWEMAKEIADKLPGKSEKSGEPKCETCGTPLYESKKEKR
jgi:formylmethanofuran dehydrogenase subunit E